MSAVMFTNRLCFFQEVFVCVFAHFLLCSFFLKILFIYFQREGKGGRKKGRRKHRCERETWIGGLSYSSDCLGTEPATQARGLTRNQTDDLSLCRMMPNQQNHTGQGSTAFFTSLVLWIRRQFYILCSPWFHLYDIPKMSYMSQGKPGG